MKGRWIAAGLIILAVTLGAMACSNSKSTTTKKTPGATTARTPSMTHAASTSTGGSAQSEITATLVEYQISLTASSVPAGQVKFTAKNIGSTQHELMVHKTDLAPTALPTKADGSVDEADGIEMVGEVKEIDAGNSKELEVTLQPGHYVLLCNVVQEVNGVTVSHFQKGMHVEFTVQ